MENKKEVLKKFEGKLVQTLPIDDVVFNCMLIVQNVFTEDDLVAINSQPTLSDSAAKLHYYLDDMIRSENFFARLCSLLTVMEQYEGTNDNMQKLTNEMRYDLHMQRGTSLLQITSFMGHSRVGETMRETVMKAVCVIRTPKKSGEMDVATGFLCFVKLRGETSAVLVTNSHVLDNEKIPAESLIKFNGVDIPLNMKNLVVETSCVFSHKKKLDFAMIEIDWKKLKEEHPVIECIDLSKPTSVKKGDFITVIQHSPKGTLFCSSSDCFLVVDCLVIYGCGSKKKSSGGPVLKAVDGKFEVVGLHRGGFNAGHCCATKFSDILKNISGKDFKAMDVKSQAKVKVAAMKSPGPVREDRGCSTVSESVREQAKRAVCLIKAPDQKDRKLIAYGTGFFGFIQLCEKSSVVLVTNYHVINNEEIAGKSSLQFEGVDVQLELKELLVKTTFISSDENMLDYAMVEIDWRKLKEKNPVAEYIDLTKPGTIENADYITIIQHPAGGELSLSSSTCIVYKHLLLYESETAHGSSGGPILKATKVGLEIVGLHRGGYEDHYNYGSKFSEILLSISGKNEYGKQSPKDQVVKDYFRRISEEK